MRDETSVSEGRARARARIEMREVRDESEVVRASSLLHVDIYRCSERTEPEGSDTFLVVLDVK